LQSGKTYERGHILKLTISIAQGFGLETLRLGLVQASGLNWNYRWELGTEAGASGLSGSAESKAAKPYANALAEVRAKGEALVTPERKAALRSLLRYGSYKPAGRAKPSSEYLLQASLEDDFPKVNYFVDSINLVSLVSAYPISIIDLDKSGEELLVRRGFEGENYVFNQGGQSIDLKDLLCVCRKTEGDWVPTANPVRDSMVTKLFPGASRALAFIYAPGGPEGRDLEAACEQLTGYLAKASTTAEWSIL
jgi:DNA/RNA-binding domain of Phe-tRNA-synthetase-like protein